MISIFKKIHTNENVFCGKKISISDSFCDYTCRNGAHSACVLLKKCIICILVYWLKFIFNQIFFKEDGGIR